MSMQASYIAAAGTEAERKYTVFVVDDSADDRARALKELGKSPQVYNVHCFGNGDALMEHFAAHAFYNTPVMRSMPLLILLDMHMPGSSGLEILRNLREHPLTRDIPVVMLTSDTSGQTAAEAGKLQVNAFLPKPLRLADVHDVIANGKVRFARPAAGNI